MDYFAFPNITFIFCGRLISYTVGEIRLRDKHTTRICIVQTPFYCVFVLYISTQHLLAIFLAIHLLFNYMAVEYSKTQIFYRWGGRVRTEPFVKGGGPVELGANWIHGGCLANPVFTLACQQEFETPGLMSRNADGTLVKQIFFNRGNLLRRCSLNLFFNKIGQECNNRRKGLFFTPEGRVIEQELGERVRLYRAIT